MHTSTCSGLKPAKHLHTSPRILYAYALSVSEKEISHGRDSKHKSPAFNDNELDGVEPGPQPQGVRRPFQRHAALAQYSHTQ